MSGRVVYVDWVRGIAIILMAFWQVFDFFSSYNIYSDSPFFLRFINAPLHFPVLVIFSGMAGAGLYLYVSSVKGKKSFKQSFLRVLKKYSWLITLSLVFTTFVWGFCTFFTWSEAVQGVGLVGLFAFLVVWMDLPVLANLFLAIILGIFQSLVKPLLVNLFATLPFCVKSLSFDFLKSIPVNFLFRGFFSVINLLPLMIWGYAITKLLESYDEKRVFLMGFVLLCSSLLIHFFIPINFYERSPSSFILEVGLLTCLMSFMKRVSATRFSGRVSLVLLPFGRDALIVYAAHFLLVFKPLQLLGLESSFNLLFSFACATIFIIVSNLVLNSWRKHYSSQR